MRIDFLPHLFSACQTGDTDSAPLIDLPLPTFPPSFWIHLGFIQLSALPVFDALPSPFFHSYEPLSQEVSLSDHYSASVNSFPSWYESLSWSWERGPYCRPPPFLSDSHRWKTHHYWDWWIFLFIFFSRKAPEPLRISQCSECWQKFSVQSAFIKISQPYFFPASRGEEVWARVVPFLSLRPKWTNKFLSLNFKAPHFCAFCWPSWLPFPNPCSFHLFFSSQPAWSWTLEFSSFCPSKNRTWHFLPHLMKTHPEEADHPSLNWVWKEDD